MTAGKGVFGWGIGEASLKCRFLNPVSRNSASGLWLGAMHFLIGYIHPLPIISNSGGF